MAILTTNHLYNFLKNLKTGICVSTQSEWLCLSAWSLQRNHHPPPTHQRVSIFAIGVQLWSTDAFLIRIQHNRCKKPNFRQLVIGESENSWY